jgi:steroid 5-alpha reductase family enzyme
MNPQLMIAAAATIGGMMLLVWLLSIPLKDVSIVDIFWGLGFVLVAWVTFAQTGDTSELLLPVLVTIWGLRLAGYLLYRNWGESEDKRYAEMREKHGSRFPLVSLFTVFGLQAVVMWVVSLPLQGGVGQPILNNALLYASIAVWAAGLFFEAVGDWQLAAFKADPSNEGEVLDSGLWRYTRHPNYFGDFCVWWGHFGIAISAGAPWWTVVGPVVMSITLLKFSGVGLLEKTLEKSKPGYRDYIERTSAFIPLPPEKPHES